MENGSISSLRNQIDWFLIRYQLLNLGINARKSYDQLIVHFEKWNEELQKHFKVEGDSNGGISQVNENIGTTILIDDQTASVSTTLSKPGSRLVVICIS